MEAPGALMYIMLRWPTVVKRSLESVGSSRGESAYPHHNGSSTYKTRTSYEHVRAFDRDAARSPAMGEVIEIDPVRWRRTSEPAPRGSGVLGRSIGLRCGVGAAVDPILFS